MSKNIDSEQARRIFETCDQVQNIHKLNVNVTQCFFIVHIFIIYINITWCFLIVLICITYKCNTVFSDCNSVFDIFSFRAVMPRSALRSFGKWQTWKQAKARREKVYGDIKKGHQEKNTETVQNRKAIMEVKDISVPDFLSFSLSM